ncbi:hypothetical protein MBLNU459_g8349t1 [Dothideomycetes sp. NU459]
MAGNASPLLVQMEQPPEPPPSGSKRKRCQSVDACAAYPGGHEQAEDSHTPKRSRPGQWPQTDGESDGVDTKQRSVRRKHGKYGLSSLSRRHAPHDVERPSRFQEGSMTDKPSAQPPSVFVRDLSHHSLSAPSPNVDHLMDEYHDGHLRPSVEFQPQYRATLTPDTTPNTPVPPKESGFYRFGRMVASSFNPVSAWGSFSRTWKETKEDLTVRNIEENRRKAAQKAQAEQKYAELKKAGMFGKPTYSVLSNAAPSFSLEEDDNEGTESPVKQEETEMEHRDIPRDSAVTMQGVSHDASKPLPPKTQQAQSQVSGRLDSPGIQQQPEKPLKLRKSLFSIRRPSLTNLKRVRSELNLGAFAGRQSSSSLSPEKQDKADSGTLLKSQSRRDLKVQHKLSKRVSDLESKLAEARRDLQNTISGVSPVTLTSRFEKYTPSHKGRPRFIPGKLQSLPSERLLFPEQNHRRPFIHQGDDVFTPIDPTTSFNYSVGARTSNKSLPAAPWPEDQDQSHERDQDVDAIHDSHFGAPIDDETPAPVDDQYQAMDPTSLLTAQPDEPNTSTGYGDLDTKLKALDAVNKTKPSRKTGTKKRKSGSNDDKLYKPGRDDDDDTDSDVPKEKTKKKRRSATKTIEPIKNKKSAKSSGPVSKGKKTVATEIPETTETTTVIEPLHELPEIRVEPADSCEIIEIPSDNEEPARGRTSMDSQSGPLEPIYEEDAIVVTSKHDSGVSVTSIHASHLRNTSRSSMRSFTTRTRSTSPKKVNTASVSTSSQIRPSRSRGRGRGRSTSPPPLAACSKDTESVDDLVSATPGVGSVPEMPILGVQASGGAEGEKSGTNAASNARFEWPDDVF